MTATCSALAGASYEPVERWRARCFNTLDFCLACQDLSSVVGRDVLLVRISASSALSQEDCEFRLESLFLLRRLASRLCHIVELSPFGNDGPTPASRKPPNYCEHVQPGGTDP